MVATKRRRTVVVSVLAVPDGSTTPVTSLGMRAWGLAQGLLAHGQDVQVAVLSDDPRPPFTNEGLLITTHHHHPDWSQVLQGVDVVIVVFCSDAAHEITGTVAADVTVVLDLLAPWYVETAARRSTDVRHEYGPYLDGVRRWNEVLTRGDVFLCAGQAQQHYYWGVLSALGGVNPLTYDHLHILQVPFGISPEPPPATDTGNPYRELGVPQGAFVLLWFGAIYPWFDIDPLLAAVQELTAQARDVHFVVVGGRNPWVPDDIYAGGYARARQVLAPLTGSQVHFVDWVPYDTRTQWYAHADITVSLNTEGAENIFSWRTRLADLLAAEQPVITNGGDPLGELVLNAGGAFRTKNSSRALADLIKRLRAEPSLIEDAGRALGALRPRFSWAETTHELAALISVVEPLYSLEATFVREHHLQRRFSRPSEPERLIERGTHVMRRVREEGLSGVAAVLWDRAAPRLLRLGEQWRQRPQPSGERPAS